MRAQAAIRCTVAAAPMFSRASSTGKTLFVAGSGSETIIGGLGTTTYEFDAGFGNVNLQNAHAKDTFHIWCRHRRVRFDGQRYHRQRW